MSNKPKKYKLIKDLPDAKAGTIFHNAETNLYRYTSNDEETCFYIGFKVENNPEWWELIEEKPKKIEVSDLGKYDEIYPALGYFMFRVSNWEIPIHKFPAIKEAIEAILNDDDDVKGEDTVKTDLWVHKHLIGDAKLVFTDAKVPDAPKKDYEILTCATCKGISGSGYHSNTPHKYMANCLAVSPQCPIHSVKRLSDGEVFTVGERVGAYGEIESLTEKDAGIIVKFQNVTVKYDEDNYFKLNEIIKNPPATEQPFEDMKLLSLNDLLEAWKICDKYMFLEGYYKSEPLYKLFEQKAKNNYKKTKKQ